MPPFWVQLKRHQHAQSRFLWACWASNAWRNLSYASRRYSSIIEAKACHQADSALSNLTVDLTVQPLKSGENVGISENIKNGAKRLKRLDKGVEQAESEREKWVKMSDLYHRDRGLLLFSVRRLSHVVFTHDPIGLSSWTTQKQKCTRRAEHNPVRRYPSLTGNG